MVKIPIKKFNPHFNNHSSVDYQKNKKGDRSSVYLKMNTKFMLFSSIFR